MMTWLSYSQEFLSIELCDDDTNKIFTYTTDTGIPGSYYWSVDGNSPVIDGPSYSIVWGMYGEGTHTVTVGFDDAIGCSAEPVNLTVNVEICETTTMWAPNVFTPDGDENNNVWIPIGSNYSDPYLFIVNRWGNLIFESYNLSLGWDGTVSGKMCQDGVYIYFLQWRNSKNELNQTHGHITLIR
jgi:gliding motility-associated-like protein